LLQVLHDELTNELLEKINAKKQEPIKKTKFLPSIIDVEKRPFDILDS